MLNFFNETKLEKDDQEDIPQRFKFKNKQILKNIFEINKELGKGSFSNVFKVLNLEDNKFYALKIIKKKCNLILNDSKNEVKLLSSLKKKELNNITKIYKTFYFNTHFCIVFKLYNINLKKYLFKYGDLDFNKTKNITVQLLHTLIYLQKNNIIHRDLKLENILFKNNNLNDIILIDFSISIKKNETNFVNDNRIVQTIWYRAPEVYLKQKYDFRLDIWSVGCIVYELFFNKIFFKCNCDKTLFVLHNIYLNFPDEKFIRIMNCEYKNMYDNIENPSFLKLKNNIYVSKKKQFIEDHKKKKNSNLILDIIFKCCFWDCFNRPFAEELILFI